MSVRTHAISPLPPRNFGICPVTCIFDLIFGLVLEPFRTFRGFNARVLKISTMDTGRKAATRRVLSNFSSANCLSLAPPESVEVKVKWDSRHLSFGLVIWLGIGAISYF